MCLNAVNHGEMGLSGVFRETRAERLWTCREQGSDSSQWPGQICRFSGDSAYHCLHLVLIKLHWVFLWPAAMSFYTALSARRGWKDYCKSGINVMVGWVRRLSWSWTQPLTTSLQYPLPGTSHRIEAESLVPGYILTWATKYYNILCRKQKKQWRVRKDFPSLFPWFHNNVTIYTDACIKTN